MPTEVLTLNEMLANSYEPKRIYRWIFGIDGLDAYTAKTFARPSRTFEEIVIDWINTKHWLAGKHVWNDITLVLYDPIAPSAAVKVNEWIRLNYEEQTGRAGYAENYKKNVYIKMLDPVGAIAEKWEIGGAWPREANFNELDYASSEAATVSLTLRYDSAQIVAAAAGSPISLA